MHSILHSFKKWFLLIVLIVISAAFFYFDLYRYLSFETIKTYQATAQEWTQLHYRYATILYIAIFILLVACAIPCATFLTLLGGFLFGSMAIFYAHFSTTCGGAILFLAVRTAIGSRLTQRSSGLIKRFEDGFQRNAFQYLLMLRLIPVFPCWVSNISAGVLNVPFRTFVSATAIGILPATIIYVLVGRGLDKLLFANPPQLSLLLTPSIFFPLLGLTLLSVFPIFYKYLKTSKL